MVLHDLTMAARYADHLIALPSEVLQATFRLPSRVITDPLSRHHVREDAA